MSKAGLKQRTIVGHLYEKGLGLLRTGSIGLRRKRLPYMSMRKDPLTMKAPYGNPRITSLPGMLSVLSWQPDHLHIGIFRVKRD